MNVIADNALVSGFAVQQRPVTTQLVREVCLDFDFDVATRRSSGEAAPASTQLPRGQRALTESDQRVLDATASPARKTAAQRISGFAAPAFDALGLKKH